MKNIASTIPYKGVRKVIGRQMMIAQTYPLTYDAIDIDMTDLMVFRKKFNEEHGTRITINDFVIKAASLALQEVPIINSALSEDEKTIEVYESCNISVMTASEKGLVAPVIKEAQTKSIFQISEEVKVLVEKANAGKLTMEEMSEGTFGVTNVGKLNVTLAIPMPQPPQPAILAIGVIEKRAVVLNDGKDTIAARSMMTVNIGGDHRILDGVPLGQFVNSMKKFLEDPESLVK